MAGGLKPDHVVDPAAKGMLFVMNMQAGFLAPFSHRYMRVLQKYMKFLQSVLFKSEASLPMLSWLRIIARYD